MAERERFRLPRLFWVGFWIFVVGSGPLLIFIAADAVGLVSDPNPNPIGLGLLFFVSFVPSLVIMGVGTGVAVRRWRSGS